MIFKSNKRKYFTKNKAIDLMVYLSATGANSETRWRGLHNSYKRQDLQSHWAEYWKN